MKIRDRIKKLVRVRASELIPNPKNWRVHPESQQNALRGVLAEVGIADAVLARETKDGLQLIDGHLRADIDPTLEWPVLVLDVTEEEADKILLTHDPLANMAEVDDGMLSQLLEEIETESADLQKMLDELPTPAAVDVEIVEDEVPETPDDPVTRTGDLILLGDHRLLCGDSTNADNAKRLIAAAPVALMVTDPPYSSGAKQEGQKRNSSSIGTRSTETIQRDNLNTRGYMELLRLAVQSSTPSTAYVFTDWRMWTWTTDVLEACGLSVRNMLVWDKQQMGMGFPWRNQHELIAFCKSSPARIMDGKRGNVLQCPRTRNEHHETEKPVTLISQLIQNSEPGSVFDPFMGGGSTLLAAEQLDRTCYGMEISPAYCDVIVKRWETLTGDKAQRPKRKK